MPLSDGLLEQISVVLAQPDPGYREVQRLAKSCDVECDRRGSKEVLLMALRERLAEEDTGDALFRLGLYYAQDSRAWSKAAAQDPKKAAVLFQQAADLEDPDAQCELGCCYANGFGVDQNYGRAVALFRQSIDNTDHPEAHLELGCCYMEGLGVEEDLNLAVEHLEAAVQYVDAMDELDKCRHELRMVEEARQQEAEWNYLHFQEMEKNFGYLLLD